MKSETRDELIRANGADPDKFREYMRDLDVHNETDTDEYRETQPMKGFAFISEFFTDFVAPDEARREMYDLVAVWVNTRPNEFSYQGANELVPVLNLCFDEIWRNGGFSLYGDDDILLFDRIADFHTDQGIIEQGGG